MGAANCDDEAEASDGNVASSGIRGSFRRIRERSGEPECFLYRIVPLGDTTRSIDFDGEESAIGRNSS